MDIWLWGCNVAPKTYKYEFLDAPWVRDICPIGQIGGTYGWSLGGAHYPSSPQPPAGCVTGSLCSYTTTCLKFPMLLDRSVDELEAIVGPIVALSVPVHTPSTCIRTSQLLPAFYLLS